MAFKRIVANSEEDLKTIMNNIKTWFKETNDYKTEFTTEKRKFQDPDTKAIVEKNIDVIKATDNANDKFSTIKFIPMKEKGEMKVEIGGEGEAAVSGKITNQLKGKGKLKSYSKDKKVALKEDPKEEYNDLMSKIKSSFKHQVTGGKKGEPMSKGQKLTPNTKITKSELKEIIKEEIKKSLNESNIINAGDKLKQIEFADRGDYIAVKFYNQMLGKNSTLLIYKNDVDEVINIINSLK